MMVARADLPNETLSKTVNIISSSNSQNRSSSSSAVDTKWLSESADEGVIERAVVDDNTMSTTGLEEALLISIVMALWAGSLVLFWVRWKKIRVLEPYQPQFYEAQHDPICPMVAQQPCFTPMTADSDNPFGLFPFIPNCSPKLQHKAGQGMVSYDKRLSSSAPISKRASANSLITSSQNSHRTRSVFYQQGALMNDPPTTTDFAANDDQMPFWQQPSNRFSNKSEDADADRPHHQRLSLGITKSWESNEKLPKAIHFPADEDIEDKEDQQPSCPDIRIVIQPKTSIEDRDPGQNDEDSSAADPSSCDRTVPAGQSGTAAYWDSNELTANDNSRKARRPSKLHLLTTSAEGDVTGRFGAPRKSLANLVDEVVLFPRQSRSSSIFRLGHQRPQPPSCRFCRRETLQVNRHAAILPPGLRRASRLSVAHKTSSCQRYPGMSNPDKPTVRTSPNSLRKVSQYFPSGSEHQAAYSSTLKMPWQDESKHHGVCNHEGCGLGDADVNFHAETRKEPAAAGEDTVDVHAASEATKDLERGSCDSSGEKEQMNSGVIQVRKMGSRSNAPCTLTGEPGSAT